MALLRRPLQSSVCRHREPLFAERTRSQGESSVSVELAQFQAPCRSKRFLFERSTPQGFAISKSAKRSGLRNNAGLPRRAQSDPIIARQINHQQGSKVARTVGGCARMHADTGPCGLRAIHPFHRPLARKRVPATRSFAERNSQHLANLARTSARAGVAGTKEKGGRRTDLPNL